MADEPKKSKLSFVDDDTKASVGRSPPGKEAAASKTKETASSAKASSTKAKAGAGKSAEKAAAEKSAKGKKLKSDFDKAKERKEQLRFGKADISVDEISRMSKEQKREMYATAALRSAAHQEVEEYEDDNVGVKSAHELEKGAEFGDELEHSRYAKKLKKRKKELKAREKAAKEKAGAAEQQKAENSAKDAAKDNAEGISNPISRWKQRQANRQYAHAAAQAGKTASEQSAASSSVSTVKNGVGDIVARGKEFVGGVAQGAAVVVQSNPEIIVVVGVLAVLLLLIMSGFSSCSVLFSGTTQVMGQVSYTAEDEDILGAEEDYTQLEEELQKKINQIPLEYPGMDEYDYNLDEIGHDPWQLASYLTTLFDDYTRAEVQATLKATFEKQYELTIREEVQIRYKTVQVAIPDPPYVVTTVVPYEYKILHVTLRNYGLESVITEELDDDQLKRYEILQDTKGGRPYLFDASYSSITSDGSGESGIDYQVPAEALTDPEFAAMLAEAEKYLGTPYVWGGSTPETGFDCSGYVCWVLNQSGWDIDRTTANGLWEQSVKISEAEAQPGDLVFFEGTYDTVGASHVGIYVGNGMMISAGDPIKYSNIHSSYWDSHILGFGRLS